MNSWEYIVCCVCILFLTVYYFMDIFHDARTTINTIKYFHTISCLISFPSYLINYLCILLISNLCGSYAVYYSLFRFLIYFYYMFISIFIFTIFYYIDLFLISSFFKHRKEKIMILILTSIRKSYHDIHSYYTCILLWYKC